MTASDAIRWARWTSASRASKPSSTTTQVASTTEARSSACGPSRTSGRASSSTGTAASGSRWCISSRPSGSSTRSRCPTGPPSATSRTCCGSRASSFAWSTGPGFFKECASSLVASYVVPGLSVELRCNAEVLPFRLDSVGAIVMVDTLYHLPRPLDFLSDAARVLKPGGRLAMVEPWITPPSWVLYRYFHHEECRVGVDMARPFGSDPEGALDGSAAIPYLLLARFSGSGLPLHLVRVGPFVGLPYLATFGFKVGRPLPGFVQSLAGAAEAALRPLARWLATRIFILLEKPHAG